MKPEPPMVALDTMPKLLREKAQRLGERAVAMRVKDRGVWKRYTWRDYHERVKFLAMGMVSLGLVVEGLLASACSSPAGRSLTSRPAAHD